MLTIRGIIGDVEHMVDVTAQGLSGDGPVVHWIKDLMPADVADPVAHVLTLADELRRLFGESLQMTHTPESESSHANDHQS